MCRSRAFLLTAVAAASLLLPAGSYAASDPPCSPGVGVGLVDFPAGTRDPRARTYIVDHVRPGARFSRQFQVCNGTAQPVALQLYAGPAEVTDGVFRILEGRPASELSSWITVTPSTVRLRPGQRVLARATFAVPAAATEGERYGALLAELPAGRSSNGIPVASRVGVRVYLDVGPGGAPKSDFVVDSLQAGRGADGRGVVTAQVHNTGKRALDMSGSLTLRSGPGGLTGGPYPARLGTTLAPGDTEPVLVTIERAVADGPWTAQLTLRSGLLERRVEAGITFPDAPGEQAPPVDVQQIRAPGDEEIRPWGALLALIPLAVGAFFVVRRRRATASTPPGSAPAAGR